MYFFSTWFNTDLFYFLNILEVEKVSDWNGSYDWEINLLSNYDEYFHLFLQWISFLIDLLINCLTLASFQNQNCHLMIAIWKLKVLSFLSLLSDPFYMLIFLSLTFWYGKRILLYLYLSQNERDVHCDFLILFYHPHP